MTAANSDALEPLDAVIERGVLQLAAGGAPEYTTLEAAAIALELQPDTVRRKFQSVCTKQRVNGRRRTVIPTAALLAAFDHVTVRTLIQRFTSALAEEQAAREKLEARFETRIAALETEMRRSGNSRASSNAAAATDAIRNER